MAKVKFEDGTVINFQGEPSQQEIEEAYSKVAGSTPEQQRFETGLGKLQQATTDPNALSWLQRIIQAPQQVEQKIQARPDTLQSLMKEIEFQQTQPRGVFKDPITPLVTGMKTMAIPFQRAEALTTTPVVSAQQGRFKQIPEDIYKAAIGKRQTELGDIARMLGAPEPIAATLGFAGTAFLTNKLLSFRAPKMLKETTDTFTSALRKFGRTKAKGLIRTLTGMSEGATEYAVKEGGHNVFLKKYIPQKQWQESFLNKIRKGLPHIKNSALRNWATANFGKSARLDTTIPYKQTLRIQEGLKVAFRNAIKKYGDEFNSILDDVAGKYPEGKMPIESMSRALQGVLQREGIIGGRGELMKFVDDMTPMQKELLKMNDELMKMAQGNASITLKDYVKVRRGLWSKMKSRALKGDIPYGGDEHTMLELIGELDRVIPQGISDDIARINAEYSNFRQVFNPANKMFTPFKGRYYTKSGESIFNKYENLSQGEKLLVDDIDNLLPTEYKFGNTLSKYVTDKSYKLGVDELPKASGYNKVKDYWQMTPEEQSYMQAIDRDLPYDLKFLDDFKKWSTTQEALVRPSGQGITPYRLRILGELGKYGTRQFLRFKEPTMSKVRPLIPPYLLREVSGRNK